ncbi:transcriptional regulator family: Fungal Specific TF [Paecilomyces variotii]|nr:transcriptional regulator family: Fungal Specific TF [Paecilomyces variotii]KAJ9375571.1 transcriptional regulator family: Fungal Specific TF [Paecilomyces variotii]KAJ9409146.1 transcriptional regulator family: Fungal Specific TF [Paecilomyces variotii]
MVFPGRLSTACYRCRRRKVKCDATRPSCRRCMIYGKECTGYPSSFAFRTYKPTGQEGDPSQGSALLKCKDNTMQRRLEGEVDRVGGSNGPTSTSSVPHSPVLCLEWQSLCYFFHQHVLQVARSPCEGHLAFFPELYQERGDDPCLRNAILSVSYLTLFNTSGVQQLQVHARKHYGAALNSLIATLNSNELALRDEVVAASLFLSMFTDLSGERESILNPHIPGISSLMQSWGRTQLRSKYGRRLFGWAVTQIQMQAMFNKQYRYTALPESVKTQYNPDIVYLAGTIAGKISDFHNAASETRQILCSAIPNPEPAEKLFCALFKKAHSLFEDIDVWHKGIPRHWRCQYEAPAAENNTPATPENATRDPWTRCFLASSHAAQISFYSHVIKCYDDFRSFGLTLADPIFRNIPVELFNNLDGRIRYLTDLVCSTVTTALGSIDKHGYFRLLPHSKVANGYTLLWPMWVVANCEFSTAEQASLCQQGLQCVGTAMGCKLALSLSQTSASIMPE